MNWFSQVAIFVLIWFVVLFAVLPIGVRRQENPEPGHDPGAPVQPMLWRKAMWTTAISLIIWGVYYVVTRVYGISLLDLVNRP
jgi:predicted secreted protein